MTAGRRSGIVPQSDNDIRLIIQEAQNRWLRPQEVCEILKNYKQHNFKLNPVPPQTPQSGSLFLFDRKALRYFRKDGHNWRKKKDGKTVREAHERLKAGSVDVLHCYYAHGEDNANFQRRAYWMLEPAHEHIVLVHYREVTEGNRLLMRPQEHADRSSNAVNPASVHSQPTPFGHSNYSSLHMANSMASPETVEMAAASHSPELEEVESADPDELEEAVSDVIGDQQQGLQPSLLEQLTDRSLVPPMNRPGGEPWEPGFRKANSGGVDGHVDAGLYMPQGDFKPSFPSLPQLQPRAPSLSNFHQGGGMSSISRIEDLLDSPGTSFNPHHGNTSSNSMDLSSWSNLLENSRGSGGLGSGGASFVKQELNSPSPWEAMLAQVTTPATRRTLLQGAGLAQPSPLGRDTASHSVGFPVSPKGKGIADALSPRNLGREPQTALEADLRTVSEKIVLREAEEKKHQALRNRWVSPGSESNAMDASNQQMQSQSIPKPQQNVIFGESDTLSALVRPWSQPQQQQQQQPPPQQQLQQQLRNPQAVQNMNQYEQHGNQGQLNFPREDPKLQVLTSAPQPNVVFLDSPGMFSPTIESLLNNVRSDAEGGNLNNMDSFKKFGSFGKLDSFGRWMNNADDITEISSMAPSSGSLWYPADPEDAMAGVSQVMEGLAPPVSLSEQLLNVIDFSPEWGFSTEETKVIISVSSVKAPSTDQKWHCMFGTMEVPAELLGDGSLRCKAPHQDSGTVPFYITRGDRQACSQVREFEYRAPLILPDELLSQTLASQSEVETKDELLLKIRLARMLLGHESSVNNGRAGSRTTIFEESDDDEWRSLEAMVTSSTKPLREIKEQLLETIFKHKLEEWLISKKKSGEGKSPSVLDDRGQGVPHFMAALGYDWSMAPIFAAGVAKNFRDDSGWTALHWAAKYGREKAVVALIDAGASLSSITDPNHRFPRGETAADLAAAGGHGGIAGFLAEKSLTERLSSMTLKDEEILNEIDKMTANMEGEKAVALLARRTSIVRSVREPGDEKILETSLKAVRASTHTGALLQSAYRLHSFRRRTQQLDDFDEYGLTPTEVEDLRAARKIQQAFRGHNQKNKMKQHLAATRIQQKYRGWKGRKEYQTMRQRIIKIQAHVRGKLVRRKYKKIVWSVSIVEKVVLRWLRKRKGLRGFQSKEIEEAVDDNEDLTKEGRQAQKVFVQMDVNKVVTMARQKCDRDQYLRLVVEEKRTSASKGELNEMTDYLNTPRDYMD